MAKEYIEREAALAALCRDCDKMVPPDEREPCRSRFTGCMEYYDIFELPASDVRPVVRGRWIRNATSNLHMNCSNCGKVFSNVFQPLLFNYCPNCGADMREAQHDY